MQESSDAQLLREYAELRSEPAFRCLVERHADLVYSSALRQVGSFDEAQDISQSVFADLARKSRLLAKQLKPDASLAGWLYRGTRYAASTVVRSERRRVAREREVMEFQTPNVETMTDWERVRLVLDEAMAALGDTDREAVLLRYFKRLDFSAVGAALGMSDDAAQKRVARSLEKLRAHLQRHGVSTTTAGLGAVLTANAVQSAPAGFAAALASSSVIGVVESGTPVTILNFMASTKLKTALVAAVMILAVGTPVLVQHRVEAGLGELDARLKARVDQVAVLRAENGNLSNQLAQVTSARPTANGPSEQILRLRGEVGRLLIDVRELSKAKASVPVTRSEMLAAMAQHYSERAARLKEVLDANPSEKILELQFLTDKDWLWLANQANFDSEEGYLRAMSLARQMGQENFAADVLRPALDGFVQDHGRQFPRALSQLKPYFKSPVDEVLPRWEILQKTNLVKELQREVSENWFITQRAPVNPVLDQRIIIGLTNTISFASGPTNRWVVIP